MIESTGTTYISHNGFEFPLHECTRAMGQMNGKCSVFEYTMSKIETRLTSDSFYDDQLVSYVGTKNHAIEQYISCLCPASNWTYILAIDYNLIPESNVGAVPDHEDCMNQAAGKCVNGLNANCLYGNVYSDLDADSSINVDDQTATIESINCSSTKTYELDNVDATNALEKLGKITTVYNRRTPADFTKIQQLEYRKAIYNDEKFFLMCEKA